MLCHVIATSNCRARDDIARHEEETDREESGRMSVDVGDKAPDFTMATDDGSEISLSALKGRNLVLYFYPQ